MVIKWIPFSAASTCASWLMSSATFKYHLGWTRRAGRSGNTEAVDERTIDAVVEAGVDLARGASALVVGLAVARMKPCVRRLRAQFTVGPFATPGPRSRAGGLRRSWPRPYFRRRGSACRVASAAPSSRHDRRRSSLCSQSLLTTPVMMPSAVRRAAAARESVEAGLPARVGDLEHVGAVVQAGGVLWSPTPGFTVRWASFFEA